MNIEKIEIKPNQYVWVDKDAEINENDFILTKDNKVVEVSYLLSKDLEQANKIIAASPELNLDVLTYVEYLAENNYEATKYSPFESTKVAFIKGYESAEKEKSDELLTKYQEGFAKALKLCNGSDFIDEVERNRAIDFAKWISCSYSYGNISGLWSFHENTSKQYTEEELYELYFKQLKQSEL